jgi:predicted PurR-regulated permease PerM
MNTRGLTQVNKIIFFFFLVFAAAYFAKSVLIPFTLAGLLAMLFLPVSNWFENKGIQRGWAAFLCTVIFLLIIAAIITLIGWQVSNLAEDKAKMQQQFEQMIQKVQQTINNKVGIPPEKQKQIVQQQQQQASSGSSGAGKGISSVMQFIIDGILLVVYIFFLLYSRSRIKKFILKLPPDEEKEHTEKVVGDIAKVSQQYLTGLAKMIACLWVMYGIAFSIIGVKNALFFAFLCGILEIIPFVGNITGTTITVLMAVTQGGGGGMVMGILVTYGIVQFIQGNVLEPFLVGNEVNINPLATIVVIVVAEAIWGIPGMMLGIPLLAIIKIICQNVKGLQPYSYLIGQDKKEQQPGIVDKIKGWFKK